MNQATLTGRADVRVEVLPARAAYLVKAGDRQAALTAVWEASSRWAGVTEPIIPVRADGRIDAWWQQVIELSNVDGLVNVNLPSGFAESAKTRFGLPVVDVAEIDRSGVTKCSVHPVFVGEGGPEESESLWVMAGDRGGWWQRFAVGDYHPDHHDDLRVLPVTRLVGSANVVEACSAQIQETSLLDYGARHFRAHSTSTQRRDRDLLAPAPVVLWFTKRNNLRDCISFWNLRALRTFRITRSSMVLLPVIPEADWDQLARQIATRLRRHDDVEPDVMLCSHSVEDAALDDIADRLGLVPSSVPPYSRWTDPRPPLRQAPYTYRIDMDPRQFVDHKRRYGARATTSVQVYDQTAEVEFDSPVKFNGPGELLIRLRSDLFDGLPRHPVVAKQIDEDAIWRDDSLQVCAGTANSYRFDIHVPSLREAAWRLLREGCTQASLSDKGRMAERLLELGGHDVLLKSHVRRTIETLRTRRSKAVAAELARHFTDGVVPEVLAELAMRLGEAQQRRFQSVQQLRSAVGRQATMSAETLCHQHWAERGFSIKCERCSVRSFVPLAETQPEGVCPACLAAHTYEIAATTGAPELQYRLNGLIDFAADQGVLPHVMAIAALREKNEQTFLIPGADVEFADGPPREVDLFGIHDGSVVAGEAKTSPAGHDVADLEADIGLTAALGADTHLMVAIGDIAEPAVEQAKQLTQAANLGLIVIQGENVTYVNHDG